MLWGIFNEQRPGVSQPGEHKQGKPLWNNAGGQSNRACNQSKRRETKWRMDYSAKGTHKGEERLASANNNPPVHHKRLATKSVDRGSRPRWATRIMGRSQIQADTVRAKIQGGRSLDPEKRATCICLSFPITMTRMCMALLPKETFYKKFHIHLPSRVPMDLSTYPCGEQAKLYWHEVEL